ncbi:MAG: DEAD/DEAH box helicase, partial [Planctomycetaceae bacterium]
MPENPLATPVQFLKGCGPDRAQLLAKLGLNTVEDVLFYLPRDVLDLTDVRPPSRLEAGVVQTVRGRIADVDAKAISRGRTMQAVLLDCGGEYVRGVWFNQVWVQQTFQGGGVVLFSGKPKRHAGRWEFPHPRVQWLEDEEGESHGGVLPRYGLTEGLRMHEIRRIIRTAVEQYADAVPEHLPEFFRDELKLPHVGTALRSLHQPSDMQQYETARHRLLFDDLLEFQLALAMRRRAWKRRDAAPELPLTPKIDARIRRLFPFAFTPGQNEAVREICDDLASGRAMHRLLQADVGAGKTAVAIYAMLVTITAGRQTVLMAPTEV